VSNFDPAKVGGWVDGEPITGLQITKIQSQQVKAVNGDDGSDHVGSVSLGGMKAAHFTDKVLTSGPHSTTPIAITWDANSYGALRIQSTRNNATQGVITITMSNMVAGDRYYLEYESTADPEDYSIVFASPAQHVFEDGNNEPLPEGAKTTWIGRALTTTLVLWAVLQNGAE
jgi:hypothetical protein